MGTSSVPGNDDSQHDVATTDETVVAPAKYKKPSVKYRLRAMIHRYVETLDDSMSRSYIGGADGGSGQKGDPQAKERSADCLD